MVRSADIHIYMNVIALTCVAAYQSQYPTYWHQNLKCPSFCNCDLYNGHNRADCAGRRLIDSRTELPPSVEILDLSFNNIGNLDKSSFQTYPYLANLTLAYNAIKYVYYDTFGKNPHLTSVDLSYNRIENMDLSVFETNHELITLHLEGNKFSALPFGSLLRSRSLRVLNLRNSELSHISIVLFRELPSLREIDLSMNLITQMSSTVFAQRSLQILNLNENPWKCSSQLLGDVRALQLRGVNVSMNNCDFEKKVVPTVVKFERMEMSNEKNSTNETANNANGTNSEELIWVKPHAETPNASEEIEDRNTPTILGNRWRSLSEINQDQEDREYNDLYGINDEACNGSRDQVCRHLQRCMLRVKNLILLESYRPNIQETNGTYTSYDVNFIFLLGMAAGITIVVFIVTCALCFKGLLEKRQYPKDDTTSAAPIGIATAERPARRSWCSTHPQNDPNRGNFISRLFGRGSARHYVRTFNQNTATLVRRLSRSNLFVNRERGARQDSDHANNLNTPFADAEVNVQSESPTIEPQIHAGRPETPPPYYLDVVVVNDMDKTK